MSRSRTLHLTTTRRALPSLTISASPSVLMNSASWVTGTRSPLGALTVRLRRPARPFPSRNNRTTRSNLRSPSKIRLTVRPFVAASITSCTSRTLIAWRAAAARSTMMRSSGMPTS